VYKVLNINKNDVIKLDTLLDKDIDSITKILTEYKNGKPLNKIFCEQNFYGFDFFINENVLAPRQDTEILVENAINLIKSNNKIVNVLDLCTGSGCIGITVKKLCDNANVLLSDISNDALNVAKINSEKLNVNVNFCNSDLFNNIPKQKFDFILSNPPYIKNSDINSLDLEVLLYDPHIALFGGDDGLTFYRKILQNANEFLNDDGFILFEIGYDICFQVTNLAKKYGFSVKPIKDYSGIDRVLLLKK
ncbi:MAG: peptide chain release factor N(5)-glutamine methyltransferase, partial [Clostridia bacterium]|nr:peptide chain release factor N(5)-glutamine methyltransferase [Clostridia bacterium]